MKRRLSILGLSLGACVASVSAAASLGSPSDVEPAPVVAMAALGDSLTTAWGAFGAAADNPSQSWSTGDDPAIRSRSQRLVKANPELAGHAYNDAQTGSSMRATYDQAAQAVAQGAQYATIAAGTNDVLSHEYGRHDRSR